MDSSLNGFTTLYIPSGLDVQIHSPDTYNCKVKIYPDGSENMCIHQNDVFGGDPYSSSRKALSDFSAKRAEYMKEFQEDYERSNFLVYDSDSMQYPRSLQSLIDDNIRLMDFGYISAAECVRRNQTLYKEFREMKKYDPFKTNLKTPVKEIRSDSLKRAKDSIFDYIMCNDWSYFFTGTINPKKMDSSKPSECLRPLIKWFSNMQQRYGISYICIFEYHKKGNIHMHGLIREDSDKPLKLVDSKTKSYYGFKKPMKNKTARKYGLDPQKGITVYNLQTWRFGWSTAIKTYGIPQQLAHYVTKYLTKDAKKIFGRYFWHSRDLKKPRIEYRNMDWFAVPSADYHGFKYQVKMPDDLGEQNKTPFSERESER